MCAVIRALDHRDHRLAVCAVVVHAPVLDDPCAARTAEPMIATACRGHRCERDHHPAHASRYHAAPRGPLQRGMLGAGVPRRPDTAPSPLVIQWTALRLNSSLQQAAMLLDDLYDRLSIEYPYRASDQGALPEGLLVADDWKLLSHNLDGNPPFLKHLRFGHLAMVAIKLSRPLLDVVKRIDWLAAQLPWLHTPRWRDSDWEALVMAFGELTIDQKNSVVERLTNIYSKIDPETPENLERPLRILNSVRGILPDSGIRRLDGYSDEDRILLSRDLDGNDPLVRACPVIPGVVDGEVSEGAATVGAEHRAARGGHPWQRHVDPAVGRRSCSRVPNAPSSRSRRPIGSC